METGVESQMFQPGSVAGFAGGAGESYEAGIGSGVQLQIVVDSVVLLSGVDGSMG